MAGKGLSKTVLGWFVTQDGDGDHPDAPAQSQVPSADALIAKYAQPQAPAPAPEPMPVQFSGVLPQAPLPGAAIDFLAVYKAASISEEEQQRVEKARALLSSLPNETPREIKKQIVEASLKAFGVPVDKIIEAGAQQIQALEAYIRQGEVGTQSLLSESAARIEQLTAEIAQIKSIMESQLVAQQALARASNEEKLRVQVVLEFFGQEAVARVVKESPKLVEPT